MVEAQPADDRRVRAAAHDSLVPRAGARGAARAGRDDHGSRRARRTSLDDPALLRALDEVAWEMRAKKLFLFAPERMALSMERLAHYCGTPAESFQRYVLFTNYAMHVEEFRARFPDAEGPERPGVQMPAWHHRTPDQDGVSIVDIGVGPSNAKTVTDHLAVLRPDAMLMIGHCAGLRNHQDIGDYVLATAYLRDDRILDHALPTTIPVIPNHRLNSYLLNALDGHEARYRIGTVLTTANRNWELEIEAMEHTFEQSRAVAVDMESATIAANGFRYRIPSATLLAISDKPLHGSPKLAEQAEGVLRREPARPPRDRARVHRPGPPRAPGRHPERRHPQPGRAAVRRPDRRQGRPQVSHEHRGDHASDEICVNPLFARRSEHAIPRWRIPDDEMLPETAYQIIHDELFLDGNARQNLATFVTTWMEPEATQLYIGIVRQEHDRQGRVPADRRDRGTLPAHPRRPVERARSPRDDRHVGDRVVGGVHARRSRVQAALAARAAPRGKSTESPNIVFSSAVQVVWEKFANYFEVEPRYVPITKEKPYLTVDGMLAAVDENTIGVVPILGVTYNGVYEPVKELAGALDDLQTRTGLDVPMHVDAASGGFIAPFLDPAPRMGLPRAARALDQRVGAQVRPRVPRPRMGRVGQARVRARGADLQRELPRRRTCRRSR